MADPRKFRGVRLSPQGDGYVQLVATREHITWSEALRRLLALGARVDMETHNGIGRPDSRAERSDHAGDQRPDHGDGSGRDFDGDAGSGSVPRLPDSGPAVRAGGDHAGGGGIGDALGNLIQGGFRPEAVDSDSPGAA